MRKFFLVIVITVWTQLLAAQTSNVVRHSIPLVKGEYWWVGIINHGNLMPVTNGYKASLAANLYGNQAQPLLLSSKGNVVWSEEDFDIVCSDSQIVLTKSKGEFAVASGGKTLKEGYLFASKTFFPPSGATPDPLLFSHPQYNTWIELLYDQNQRDVLKYAKSIIDNGFPPGVIMIDDNWQEDYGTWRFRADRFPDPAGMIDTLHRWGFKVMVWVCPFVSPDSEVFRKLMAKNALLNDTAGYPKMVNWWNGTSAVLDFTDTVAVNWFDGVLHELMSKYKVDGFKFDAGDAEYYTDVVADQNISPDEHAEAFAKIGLKYPLNEYRATWKMGGQALAQRLRDKGHSWEDLQVLIPNILLQGIMGYAFTCPDMIGGGEMGSFVNLQTINQDLVVRSAQVHALMPMMQFSVAPWRILDAEHLEAVKKAITLRSAFVKTIESLKEAAAKTGEPIVRMMAYEFPGQNMELIDDQFMLGQKILVAPILTAGNTRKVVLPKGKWKDMLRNKLISGGKTVEVTAGLGELPVFVRE